MVENQLTKSDFKDKYIKPYPIEIPCVVISKHTKRACELGRIHTTTKRHVSSACGLDTFLAHIPLVYFLQSNS